MSEIENSNPMDIDGDEESIGWNSDFEPTNSDFELNNSDFEPTNSDLEPTNSDLDPTNSDLEPTKSDFEDDGSKQLVMDTETGAFFCIICAGNNESRMFATAGRLYRHMTRFHRINKKGEKIQDPDEKNCLDIVCPVCSRKDFVTQKSYYRHINRVHRINRRGEKLPPKLGDKELGEMVSDEESADLELDFVLPEEFLKRPRDKQTDGEVLVCPECAKVKIYRAYSTPKQYHRHMADVHRIDRRGRPRPLTEEQAKAKKEADEKRKEWVMRRKAEGGNEKKEEGGGNEEEKKKEEEGKEKKEKKLFPCSQCVWVFKNGANLRRHIMNMHPTDDMERLKCGYCTFQTTVAYYMVRHVKKHEERNATMFPCSYCMRNFNSALTLARHEKKVHINRQQKNIEKHCPLCSFVSTRQRRTEIDLHLTTDHKINIEWQTFTLANRSEFQTWKTTLERSTNTQYRKHRSQKANRFFTCNMSGSKFCPSSVWMKLIDNGVVKVQYMPTHVGHEWGLAVKNEPVAENVRRKRTTKPDRKRTTKVDRKQTTKPDRKLKAQSDKKFTARRINTRSKMIVGNRLSSSDEEDTVSSNNDITMSSSNDEDTTNEDAIASKTLVGLSQQDDSFRRGSDSDDTNDESDQHELWQVAGFRAKLQLFVDYCQDGAKNRDQMVYLESVMEQAMFNAESLRTQSQ